jgi:DNA-binding phage protein
MTARKPGAAFERYLSKRFPDASSRERFDRQVATIRATAQMVAALEASREAMSLKKSDLALRTGRKEPAVSRLLKSPSSNPTLKTWLEVLDAMDLSAEIRLRPRRRASHKLVEVHAAL